MIIDGKQIASELAVELKPKVSGLEPKRFFGAALVGDDEISRKFLEQKKRVADNLGLDFRLYELLAAISTDELRQKIRELAGSKTCGGFIVQLPLPEQLENKHYILNAIPKWKDVDCLSEAALGAFYTGRHPIAPPAVAVVEELLNRTKHADLRKLTVAVIGTGVLIGRPIAFWLQNRVAELMVFDSSSKNLHERLHEADIIISGTGKTGLFSAKHVCEGAIIIDFGYGKAESGKLAGDFEPTGAEEKNISFTKTPGGTGPILVAKLYENFWKLNTTKN